MLETNQFKMQNAKCKMPRLFARLFLIFHLSFFILNSARAFPPAPDHTLYGTVRDQYGTPLITSRATVVFIATNGVRFSTALMPGLAPGINYRMQVPMD